MRSLELLRWAAEAKTSRDEGLAGVIGGVGLAGEEDLQSAEFLGEGFEAWAIVEEQVDSLVGGDAAGEAEGEDVGVEVNAGAGFDGGEEALLAEGVSGGDDAGIDAVERAEVLVIVTPLGNLFVEELLEGLREPGGCVDAVGDGVDGVLREHLLGDLAVLHGDAVDVAGEA